MAALKYMTLLALLMAAAQTHALDRECNVRGQCRSVGVFGSTKFIRDEEECHAECVSDERCGAYTFYTDTKACLLFENCNEGVDVNCENCIYGEVKTV